jgi:hypothetical protein
MLCVQGATHWDSLGHVFYKNKMYNGYDAALSNSSGIHKNGIQHTRNKMAGRGVLLDVARFKGVDVLADGYGISNAELDACANAHGVEIRRGDFVIIRTGQMEACRKAGKWGRASSSRTVTGATKSRSPRSARIPGAWKCVRTRRRKRSNRGTGS